MRRSGPLKRRAAKRLTSIELEARDVFTAITPGYCDCGCGRFAMWRDNHHVVTKQQIKRERRGDMLWDVRNRMQLARFCHERHTSCAHKISISMVPDSAFDFAAELFGDDMRAADWISRAYGPDIDIRERRL